MCGVCGMVMGVVLRAALNDEGIPQLDNTLGRTAQSLRACTVAEAL